jgi:hypothetical protein
MLKLPLFVEIFVNYRPQSPRRATYCQKTVSSLKSKSHLYRSKPMLVLMQKSFGLDGSIRHLQLRMQNWTDSNRCQVCGAEPKGWNHTKGIRILMEASRTGPGDGRQGGEDLKRNKE